MNLRAIAASAAAVAFTAVGNAVTECKLRKPSAKYEPGTSKANNTFTETACDAIFAHFQAKERGTKFESGDQWAFIQAADLGVVVPGQDDFLRETESGVDWLIVEVGFDPAGHSVYKLHVRRTTNAPWINT